MKKPRRNNKILRSLPRPILKTCISPRNCWGCVVNWDCDINPVESCSLNFEKQRKINDDKWLEENK